MKAFIEYLAKRLVETPDLVEVHEVIGRTTNVYELRVGDGELGKIIGKKGETLNALRTILTGVAAKEHKHVLLELLE